MDGFVQSLPGDTIMEALPSTQDSMPRRAGRVIAYVGCLALSVGLVSLVKSRSVDAREPLRAGAAQGADAPSTRVDLNGLGLGFRHDVREETEAELTRKAQQACESKGRRAVVLGGTVHCGEGAAAEVDPARVAPGDHTQATGLPGGGSRVVSLEVERGTSLAELLPSEGDAPGSDPSRVARPASTRRIMSGGSPGTGGVFVYETRRDGAQVAAELTQIMAARGFVRASDMDDSTIGFLRGQEAHLVRLTKGDGGVLLVTVIEGLGTVPTGEVTR